jgi:hypothetical protein
MLLQIVVVTSIAGTKHAVAASAGARYAARMVRLNRRGHDRAKDQGANRANGCGWYSRPGDGWHEFCFHVMMLPWSA